MINSKDNSIHQGEMICDAEVALSVSMSRINLMDKRILLLVDGNNCLLGTLTDGDIRRYILAGGSIKDKSIDASNRNPVVAKSINEAVSLYKEKYIVIPIVDEKNRICSVYFGDKEQRTYDHIAIPVVINAGGKGTRLYPFTKVLPKPLIPVGELPIVELIMAEFKKYDCSKFSIIVNYKKELIKAYFYENDNIYDISWYDEETPLGTGGGLSLLRGKIKEKFFFVNCDVLLLSDYKSILDYHNLNHNYVTMVCAQKKYTIPYGVVEIDNNDGTIINMKEKPEYSFYTNTGVYVVEPEIIDLIKGDENIDFPEIINRGKQHGFKTGAYTIDESDWLDMGQLSELEKMRTKLYGE